jgi:hypothetical protein
MVAQLQTRVPIGLSSTFWMTKLNEAYRWISQKGNFIWDVKQTGQTVTAGNIYFTLPTDCDPGKPMYLAGPTSGMSSGVSVSMNSLIPYKAWDDTLDQSMSELVVPAGMYSCFSVVTAFSGMTYSYRAYLYPLSAAPVGGVGNEFNFYFYYHTDVASTEIAIGSGNYFPTPNSFDNLLIELAEAEARRIYGLAGWEIIQKRAESAITNLLDSYRSTKNVLAGLVDQQKQVSEKKLMAQERA